MKRRLISNGVLTASVFMLFALYLFISRTGLSSLMSLRVLLFFVLGMTLAAVIIGISAEFLQRSLSGLLWASITRPLAPGAIGRINAIGGAVLIVWQILVAVLFTKLAYDWFVIYFALV